MCFWKGFSIVQSHSSHIKFVCVYHYYSMYRVNFLYVLSTEEFLPLPLPLSEKGFSIGCKKVRGSYIKILCVFWIGESYPPSPPTRLNWGPSPYSILEAIFSSALLWLTTVVMLRQGTRLNN